MNIRAIRRTKRGFTLVELMIVVAIIGVLAALAIYGVRRYILNAKTAEARNGIGQMAKDASAAYNREGMKGDVLPLGSVTNIANHLCGTAVDPIPKDPLNIQAKKYQSKPTEWNAGTKDVGWYCVKYSMSDPQYFQYSYGATSTAGDPDDKFTAGAAGDLDGDTVLSSFTLEGKLQKDSDGTIVVTTSPNILETNADE